MTPALRLEFIDFDTFRDSHGTVKALDWSSPAAMEGRFLWPYMECLRWSRARRGVTFGTPPADPPTLENMWPDVSALLWQTGNGYATYFGAGPRGPHDTYERWLSYGNPGSGYEGVTTIQWAMMLTRDYLMGVAWHDDWPTTIPRVQSCLAAAGVTDSEYEAHILNSYQPTAILASNRYNRLFRVWLNGIYRDLLPVRPPTAAFMYNEGLVMRWLETHNAVP